MRKCAPGFRFHAMLRFDNLSLRRNGRVLIEQTSLELPPGARCALTGVNGSGKSSLLALILGRLEADAGQCHIPAHWRVAHVEQETPALPHSALDHVLQGEPEWHAIQHQLQDQSLSPDTISQLHQRFEEIGGWSLPARAARLLHGLGFSNSAQQRPVSAFSGGWRMRINLARALLYRSDLLLLDEPTNHLDLPAIVWLEHWLSRYEGTLLVISHDRRFLDAICDHVMHLEHQHLTLFRGNFSESETKRIAQREQRLKQAQQTERKRQQMEAFVQRFRAQASKARQAQSRLKALEKLAPVLLERSQNGLELVFPAPEQSPTPLIHLDTVTLGWSPSEPVLEQVRLTLQPGEKWGLLGPNGCGKSTLLQALAGELDPMAGQIVSARQLRVAYFAQHQIDRMPADISPRQLLQQRMPAWSEQQCWDYLGRFRFDRDQAEHTVDTLSGGQRVRLALAVLMQQQPNLLLLDEPGNHLDMESREALAVALAQWQGAFVLISHDRNLLQITCNRWLHIENRRLHVWRGELDQWLHRLRDANQNSASGKNAPTAAGESQKDRRRLAAQQRARLQPLRQQCRQAEQDMDRLQTKLHNVEQLLANPELYQNSDGEQLTALLREQGQLKQALERAEQHWLELSEKLEQAQQGLLPHP